MQAFTNWQSGASGRSADGPVPGSRSRSTPRARRRRAATPPDGQGARAGTDVRVDQSHLGPRRDGRDELRGCVLELTQNNQYGIGSGLSRYSALNLVTPSMTGLGNAEVMRAAYDVGIRQVISDATVHCEANPSPNAGYYNALVPTLLQIPRRRDGSVLQRLAAGRVDRGVRSASDRRPASATRRSSTSRAPSSRAS